VVRVVSVAFILRIYCLPITSVIDLLVKLNLTDCTVREIYPRIYIKWSDQFNVW